MSLQLPVRPSKTTVEAASPTTEVLIREARRRQRRRQLVTVVAVIIVALVGLQIGRVITTRGGGGGSPPPSSKTPPRPVPIATAGQFAGTWRVHTTAVIIEADGHGSVTWPGPLLPGESEATATPGHAELQLTAVTGTRATALVSGSTDQSVLPDGPTGLRVSAQDLLYVMPARPTTASVFRRSGLCGPRALDLTLAQQIAANINCGA